MRVLVVYGSQYGSTKEIAERVADTLREQDLAVDVKSADARFDGLETENYGAFVIGSAIHASHWLKPAVEFVRKNRVVLSQRPVWLFSSGPITDKAVAMPQADPKEIADISQWLDVQGHVVFAGSFDPNTADLSKAGWLERQISTHFIPAGDWRDWDKIEGWAFEIARDLESVLVR
jgi:menaquinone-dependent protoporphyrinogen oxidase